MDTKLIASFAPGRTLALVKFDHLPGLDLVAQVLVLARGDMDDAFLAPDPEAMATDHVEQQALGDLLSLGLLGLALRLISFPLSPLLGRRRRGHVPNHAPSVG